MSQSRFTLGALAMCGVLYLACRMSGDPVRTELTTVPVPIEATTNGGTGAADVPAATPLVQADPSPAPPPAHVERALDWLAGAQQKDGGWGAGSNARQDIRDAHAVPTDPATTAVAAIALLRAGNGLDRGAYAGALRAATEYLLGAVEAAKEAGPQITDRTGTQPQAKMGQNVDTALTAQYLARLLQDLAAEAELRPRVAKALDKCVRKIEGAQNQDGSQPGGSWAPVLQSAQGCTALELAEAAGRTVDKEKLAQARAYQRGQLAPATPAAGATGGAVDTFSVRKDAAAGVELYAFASNMRNVAAEAKKAEEMVDVAKKSGKLPASAEPDSATLKQLGVDDQRASAMEQSFRMNTIAKVRAFDEQVLDGFGNNGGEEFLSYQMKGEALVIDGGEEWAKWSTKMNERLAKVQNQDGSWSGHHCITSPTFCTATAISCLTADRDANWLRKAGALAAK